MIRAALDAGVGYIGLVASRIRGASVLDELEPHRRRAGAGAHPGRAADRREDTRARSPCRSCAEVIAAIRVDGL